ncbi:MAG TPA: hypothetical protein VKX45_05585 [Bryobacteraceae bacterium]|nr:hypothetical protein [Bryobacteraceae bacterium]
MMDRVVSWTSFEQEREENAALDYWLSRPPEERIAEVERLRREYIANLGGAQRDECGERLCGPLLLVEREPR